MDSNHQSATAPSRQPVTTNEILIGFTHCIVVDFYKSGESTDAGQLLTCTELSCCYQQHDLLRELLPQ